MLAGRLRRYDVQATYACVLSMISIPPAIAAAVFILRNLRWDLRQIIYSSDGPYLLVLAVCILCSAVPAALGVLLGWNSAGQRRNDRQARSWVGFFVGGTVVTLDIVLGIAFLMFRLPYST